MQPGPPPGLPASPTGGLVAALRIVFEQPLSPMLPPIIGRVRDLMWRHVFELHDISTAGEVIERIPVAGPILSIGLQFDDDPRYLLVAFTIGSREARQVLVWTSSLFFQYLHYHVARIALVNGAAHQMDWEAQQDPEAPARVKRWVESGHSLIERLHITS